MKYLTFSLFAFVSIWLASCASTKDPEIELKILNHVYYDQLSSASGVSVLNGKIILTGDDIPWLVELNADLSIGQRTKLSGIDSLIDGRTPSSLKADFECMETFASDGSMKTLVLSSGSKTVSRDTAVLIDHRDSMTILKQNIRPLYQKIRQQAKMGDEDINIEGLAITQQKVYLFHRGNISGNFIAVLGRAAFLHMIQSGDTSDMEMAIHRFELPVHEGIHAGFSGGCYLPEKNCLLFTASLEDTKTVTTDGEISGSMIGTIPLESIHEGTFYSTFLKSEGRIVEKKLEGISIKKVQGDSVDVVCVCDNDDGSSDLFLIGMQILGK